MKKISQFLKVMLVAGCVLLNSFAVYATDANATGASATPAAASTTNATAGTITVQNAANTKNYAIYRLFDATVSETGAHIAYRLRQDKTSLEAGSTWFDIDSAGNISAKTSLTDDAFQTDDFKNWAKSYGVKVAEKTATGAAVTFENVPYGYYLIESGLGAMVTVASTKPNAVINDKNEQKPSIDPNDPTQGKNVVTGADSGTRKTTYAVGDVVPFRFKFTAVNFETVNKQTKQIASYKVVDTPTHLSIVQNSLTVKVGDQTLATDKYTVNFDNSGVMTVVINWVDSANQNAPLYASPVTVELNYNAVVKAGAADAPAKNVAALTYRYVGDPDTTPDKPVVDPRPEDPDNPKNPEIKTYKITLSKVDGTDNSALTGAEFKLYDAQVDGNEIKLVKVGNEYRVAEKDAQGNVTEEGNGVNVVAGTNIIIKGLKGSTSYYLEEVKAPNGYNKLLARQAVKTETGTDTLVAADATATVANNRGAELPSTGGMGRTLFYIIGILLLVVVVITMISRMKMKSMNA